MVRGQRVCLERVLLGQPRVRGGIKRSVIDLDLSYELPSFCGTDADQARLEHADLPRMSIAELLRERRRAEFALAFGDAETDDWAREWLEERVSRCDALLRRRGR